MQGNSAFRNLHQLWHSSAVPLSRSPLVFCIIFFLLVRNLAGMAWDESWAVSDQRTVHWFQQGDYAKKINKFKKTNSLNCCSFDRYHSPGLILSLFAWSVFQKVLRHNWQWSSRSCTQLPVLTNSEFGQLLRHHGCFSAGTRRKLQVSSQCGLLIYSGNYGGSWLVNFCLFIYLFIFGKLETGSF